MNFQYNQQSKPHCQKCGRRSRSHNHPVNSEQHRCRHGHLLKCKRQQRLFPTELPLNPIIPQINDHHSISKNLHSRNFSRKSDKNNILIDQLIQVQQLNETRCNTQSHSDIDYEDEYRIFPDQQNSNKLQRIQQMVYLRENINK
jgi:hypothetical protein